MSDLIPNCAWTDFKKIVDAGRVSELKSCEILLPEHKFNVIIFHGDSFTTDYARTQSEYLGLKTNTVSGKDPQELLEEINCPSLIATTDVVVSRRRRNTKKVRKPSVRRAKVNV